MVRYVIQQIIPAHGVDAIHEVDGKEESYTVVCWALLECTDPEEDPGDKWQWVVGMGHVDGEDILQPFGLLSGGSTKSKFVSYSSI